MENETITSGYINKKGGCFDLLSYFKFFQVLLQPSYRKHQLSHQ